MRTFTCCWQQQARYHPVCPRTSGSLVVCARCVAKNVPGVVIQATHWTRVRADRPHLALRWSMAAQPFPIDPPIEPMLAKLATELPTGDGILYEPKWDGFRAIVFRGGGDVLIHSRDLRPLDRYFPDLHETLIAGLPDGCAIDGEIVIAPPRGLDFAALPLRLSPPASRA